MEERISLYFKDARSDKEYHLQLVAEGEGYCVYYQNGPRGGTLTPGKKTAAPVAYSVAKKAYDKVLREKTGKGYTPGESGAAFVGGELEERVTGVEPQLLNPIDPADEEAYLTDDDWAAQEKYDGHRRLIKKSGDKMVGVNRRGLSTGLPQPVVDAYHLLAKEHLFRDAVLDGELLGDVFALFDVLEIDGLDLRQQPLRERLVIVENFRTTLEGAGVSGMFGAKTARTQAEKRAFRAALVDKKAEGVVYKRLDSAYVPGRPSTGGDQVKRKFVKSATLIVEKLHATKRSIHVAAIRDDGAWVPLGKCTIPANQDVPPVGTLVEIGYLYAFGGGSLFQPVYKGRRDDLGREACTLTQLHYKAGTESDEEEEAGEVAA